MATWVVEGTRRTIQNRSSSGLFCWWPSSSVLALPGSPLFDGLHPAFPGQLLCRVSTKVSWRMVVKRADTGREIPSVGNCQKTFLWAHKLLLLRTQSALKKTFFSGVHFRGSQERVKVCTAEVGVSRCAAGLYIVILPNEFRNCSSQVKVVCPKV